MKVTMTNIDNVIPYARNPRNNDNAVDSVVSSIKEFGFRQPIVVDKENVIIVGHTRFLASRKLNLKQVPIHVAEGLTKNQIKAYRIADNRVNQNSSWDYDLLKLEFSDLPDMDKLLTGFSMDELETINNGWQTDIDLPTSDGDSLEGLKDVLKIEFESADDKDQAINFIEEALNKTSLKYEIK